MRVPVSWLGDYVELPAELDPARLHAALVKVGLEEEDVHRFEISGPVVVGEVLEFVDEPQSNGKTIRWCQVDVGPSETARDGRDIRGIVCGAHNFFVGDKVVVTLPGAVLPGPFPISARKTYGHVSDGMIASVRELGLGDEHDGILRLAELGVDADPGADAIALLGLDDWSVEVNVTTDRGYALSLRGIAREYSLSTGATFRDPAARDPLPHGGGHPVVLDDQAPIRGRTGCTHFATQLVRGIDPTRPTPPWMVARLVLAGMRSVSLPVDITNYVMLELGQPVHGYDLDKLGGAITVRRAAPGERLTTLDGQQRTLDTEDLLIADESGPIGLAGVMGGFDTEMSDTTRDVMIEAAWFDPVTVARTARRHKLWSEASKRFERGVDPALAEVAVSRTAELLAELAGGTPEEAIGFVGTVRGRAPIMLPTDYADSLVGVDFTDDEVADSLRSLGAEVVPTSTGWEVTPPGWRPDLTAKADLAEEIARIIGYDRIPAILPIAPPGRGRTRPQRLRRLVANALAAAGLSEVLAYPFLSAPSIERFGTLAGAAPAPLRLANPLDGDAPYLRTMLLPGLVAIAQRNLSRGLTELSLFELGSVYLPPASGVLGTDALPEGAAKPSDEVLQSLDAGLPAQPLHLAALFAGDQVRKQPGVAARGAGLADALATAQQLGRALGLVLAPVQSERSFAHPGRTAALVVDGEEVGFAAELLPSLAEELDLPRRVAVLEVDLGRLIELAPVEFATSALGTLPAATQDLSLVVAESVPAAEVLAAVAEGAGELLEEIRLVDDYRGAGLEPATKSLTFALRFRAADRTLTAAEATEAKLAGVALAAVRYEARLRE